MTTETSETLDEICEQAYNKKEAESSYTWATLADRLVWGLVIYMVVFHAGFIIALFIYALRLYSVPMKWGTFMWMLIYTYTTEIGITAGAHRLWTHRTYKANRPLRILLMIFYSASGFNPLYFWIRDHRVHHKYSETNADPHNAKRGFFFSHFGWLFMKRHPDCIRKGREMDMNNMSDIKADSVVMFQKKYETEMKMLFCFVIPTIIPIIVWNESILHSVLTQCFIRNMIVLNSALCVNSVAHLWGSRPYNRLINPVENIFVSLVALGEGSHNYHHTFPWDYKTAELPYMNFNITTLFIDAMAKIGWAYDLREPSPELVEKVINRIGYKSKVQEFH